MDNLFNQPPQGMPPLGEVIECDNCGGRIFRTVILLRKVSRLSTTVPSGGIAPIQLFRCDDCNAINMSLIPKGAGTPEELFGDDDISDAKIMDNE